MTVKKEKIVEMPEAAATNPAGNTLTPPRFGTKRDVVALLQLSPTLRWGCLTSSSARVAAVLTLGK
jgi:hypothetical protein